MTPGAYRGLRRALTLICASYFRLRIYDQARIPKTGGVIIAPNHRSYLDPIVTCVAVPRPAWFVGRASIVNHRFWLPFSKLLGAVAINPDKADRKALARCLELLQTGHAIVIYPEGTRKIGSKVANVYSGVAYLAIKSGCPIIPVGIAGSETALGRNARWPRPRHITVQVGAPLFPDAELAKRPREGVDGLTELMQSAIQLQFDHAQKRHE